MKLKTYVILKEDLFSNEIRISTTNSEEVYKENLRKGLISDSYKIVELCSISEEGQVKEVQVEYIGKTIIYSEVESYSLENVECERIIALISFESGFKALPFKNEEIFLKVFKENYFEKLEIKWILKVDLKEKKYIPMELEIEDFNFKLSPIELS